MRGECEIPLRRRPDRFVRMTITLPADLRREMARHRDVNWSEVARRAFASVLIFRGEGGA